MEPQDKATKSPGEKPSFWEKPFTKSYLEGMGQIMGKVTVWAFIVVVPIILLTISDVTGIGKVDPWGFLAGGGTTALLAVATETPLAVAVVVGIFVWWLWNKLF